MFFSRLPVVFPVNDQPVVECKLQQVRGAVTSVTSLLTYSSASFLHPYDLVVDPATGQPQDIYATNPRKITRYAAIPGLKQLDYNPLTDLGLEMTKNQNLQIRMGGSINVVLAPGLNVEAGGYLDQGQAILRGVFPARILIACGLPTTMQRLSQTHPNIIFPNGDMLTESRDISQAYTLRGQLNYNRAFGKHSVMAIGGMEVSRTTLDNNAYPTRFGYNDQAGTFSIFNYADYSAGLYRPDMLYGQSLTAGIGAISFRDTRFTSWYGNASYEFDRRFLVSGSVRLDLTNFFGTDPKFRLQTDMVCRRHV